MLATVCWCSNDALSAPSAEAVSPPVRPPLRLVEEEHESQQPDTEIWSACEHSQDSYKQRHMRMVKYRTECREE